MSDARTRWRLVLGEAAEDALGDAGPWRAHDEALGWLYDRGDARLRAPTRATADWLGDVHRLFEARGAAAIERDALHRFELDRLLAEPEVLARAAPDPTLLEAVLRRRPSLDAAGKQVADAFVRRTAAALQASLRLEVEAAFTGALGGRARGGSRHRFDLKRTVERNLRHWDPKLGKLVVTRPAFTRRARRPPTWQVLVLVDRSASMADAAPAATVMAACFAAMPAMEVSLLAFGPDVVDLGDRLDDPGAALLDFTLPGGTDIGRALGAARARIRAPRRALVVLVTDFREGESRPRVVGHVRALTLAGTTVLGLAALDPDAQPDFDRDLAERCAAAGATVGAMSPGDLARFVAERVRS